MVEDFSVLKSSLDYMRSPEEGRQRERKKRLERGHVQERSGQLFLLSLLSCLSYRMSQAARAGTAVSANQTTGDATSNSSRLFQKAKAKHERILFTNKHSNKTKRTLTYILRQGEN